MIKQKMYKFNKDSYLLGKDADGVKYWIEAASWDCDWYWGFGYIVSYTRRGDDINSHQHADKFLSEWWQEWNGSKPRLAETTFTEAEGWEISELLQQFYTLKETAEYFGRGKSNCGTTSIPNYPKPELVKEINEVRMPIIFERIYQILSTSES